LKSLFKFLLPLIGIIIVFFTIFCAVEFLIIPLFEIHPSSGIWKYSDDDLEIIIYIPDEMDGYFSTETNVRYKADFSYKGVKYKAILINNKYMNSLGLALVNDYKDFDNKNIEINYLLYSGYKRKRDKLIFKGVKIFDIPYKYIESIKISYEGQDLIFKKVGACSP